MVLHPRELASDLHKNAPILTLDGTIAGECRHDTTGRFQTEDFQAGSSSCFDRHTGVMQRYEIDESRCVLVVVSVLVL